MILLIIAITILFLCFASLLCLWCWETFEETEVGKLFIKRLKKKFEEEDQNG